MMIARPSSLFPMMKYFTRGEASAIAFKYACACSALTSSPGAPMIRPKYFSGDGTLLDAGTDATHGERNLASVVAFAMASDVPASGRSTGSSVLCAAASGVRKRVAKMNQYFIISPEMRSYLAREIYYHLKNFANPL